VLNVQEKCRRKVREMSAEMGRKVLRRFWSVLVPKLQKKAKTNKTEEGRWEAMRMGRRVIYSPLSCAGG